MDEAVDSRCRGHRVLEDSTPLAEHQITCNNHTFTFAALGQESEEHFADLEQLARLIEAGKVTPSVDRAYPLQDAAQALRDLEAGRVRGKVAITVTHA